MDSNFSDLLSTFTAHGVEFVVVGAHALAAHGNPRGTGDLDILVRPSPENAERVLNALHEFGSPLHDLSKSDLSSPGLIFQIGVVPVRIDIITVIEGVDFDDAWQNRVEASYGDGLRFFVLSASDLIRNKSAAGRPQDLADVQWFRENRPELFET